MLNGLTVSRVQTKLWAHVEAIEKADTKNRNARRNISARRSRFTCNKERFPVNLIVAFFFLGSKLFSNLLSLVYHGEVCLCSTHVLLSSFIGFFEIKVTAKQMRTKQERTKI